MVVVEQKKEATKQGSKELRIRMMRRNNAEAQRTQSLAERPRRNARRKRRAALTTPDLVLLSLLAERPMHGYQANLELERREIRDWAEISRPLVYYSLEKLAREGLIRSLETEAAAGGPERTTFETTENGRMALADALEREEWTTQRDHPAFLTWLALSWQARPGVFRKQLKARRKFLLKELAREKKTLQSIYEEVGHRFHEAVWMVGLMIAQLRTEIRWTLQLEQSLARRANALFPQSVFAQNLPK
jgi:DNA-binding PadR family transcriptional regulator